MLQQRLSNDFSQKRNWHSKKKLIPSITWAFWETNCDLKTQVNVNKIAKKLKMYHDYGEVSTAVL